ncbi:MAG: thioredoxin [Candidatus Kapabacteria bacterium]|nr:thioredoxin [Candidatus Kapabacteria bacterium]
MEHLTKQTFLEKVFDYETKTEWQFQGDKPCIIDFYADWCGPCKMVAPIMEELSKDYAGLVDVYKIDTEQEQELASVFGIRSIPSVLFIPINDKPRMAVGAMPKEGYQTAIKDIFGINPPIKN